MPKLNELQDRPDGIVLPNQLIAIADPATGEMYKLPLNIVLGITDITKPDPAVQILRFWKGPDDYFDIDFTLAATGGGGAASRFGIEDNTSDVDRLVNLGLSHRMQINAGNPSGLFGSLTIDPTFLQLYNQGNENISSEYTQITANGTAEGGIQMFVGGAGGSFPSTQLNLIDDGLTIQKRDGVVRNLPLSVNGTFADAAGNIALEGGGGAAARFGIEDADGTVDRSINLNSAHNFSVLNAATIDISAGDSDTGNTPYAELLLRSFEARLEYWNHASGTHASLIFGDGTSGRMQFETASAGISSMYILPNTPAAQYLPLSVNNAFADEAGNITLSKGQFADNAAAKAAGLALNDIYHTAGVLKIVI